MADDELNPTGYTPVRDVNTDGTVNTSDVNAYNVIMAEHDYGDGGRARIRLHVPYETIDAAGNYPFNDTEELTLFHERVKCLFAEHGIELAYNDNHMFSRYGILYQENGQTSESVYYSGQNELGNVGASFAEDSIDPPDENWTRAFRTEFFVIDNATTQGFENEQLAEIIRQAYYEAIQGIPSQDVPELPYRGNGNDTELDDLPNFDVDRQCKPVIPIA